MYDLSNVNVSLGSLSQINRAVDRGQKKEFDFVNTLHSFVNNREFGHGFLKDPFDPEDRSGRFVWDALSSIGQDLGDKLYKNVYHYIDNVSNSDTCKVKALISMMNMVGMKYKVLENIGSFPLEIQNLIDILSIPRQFLLRNNFMNKEFLEFLSGDSVIERVDSEVPNLSVDPTPTMLGYMSTDPQFNVTDDVYFTYIYGVIRNFIYDMLTMNYVSEDGGVSRMIYQDIGDIYPVEKNKLKDNEIEFKHINGIDPRFNQEQILDDIEVGNDSLDNYFGYERQLLEKVKADREQTSLGFIEECINNNNNNSNNSNQTDIKTNRFSFYKLRKVAEFARFVDRVYGQPTHMEMENIEIYDYDPNYMYVNEASGEDNVICGMSGNPNDDICEKMVDLVAKQMVTIIKEVIKIRNRIKLQTRKIFMKGTNNLLVFAVNEFIIDYVSQLREHIYSQTAADNPKISAYQSCIDDIYNNVKDHKFRDVEVVEYWDETEYMNISCETTSRAVNANLVNDRYFEQYVENVGGEYVVQNPIGFTTDEIKEFYLSSLGLKNTLYKYMGDTLTAENAINDHALMQFLSTMYQIAADTTFRFKDDPTLYGTKIDNVITTDRHMDLLSTMQISSFISSQIDRIGGYEFDAEQTLLDQRIDFQDGKYREYLSGIYLSAISVMFDEYNPTIQQLSSRLDSESIQLNDFLSGTYSYYFNKSDNPYCYDEDGNYTLDYMIGNGVYNPEDFYYARLEYSSEWIQQPGHCRNWPILCASTKLIEEYNELRDELYGSIIDDIVLSGFIDPNVENLKVEMDSASDFLESYKQRRTTYLTNALENFRSQAKSLKETWDSLKTTFDIDLGMLQDTSQGFYMIQVEDGGWAKGRKDKEGVENIHDIYSGSWYHTTKEGKGDYSRVSFKEIDTSTFTTKLNSVMEIVDQFGDIFYGNTSKHSSYATTTAASVPIASSTRPAFESILNDYQKLQPQLDSIIRQVEDLFYNPAIMKNGSSTLTEYKSSSSSSMQVEDRIVAVIEVLGTKISDAQFANDLIIDSLTRHINKLIELQGIFTVKNERYQNIWQTFGQFLMNFQSDCDQNVWGPTILQQIYDYTIKQDDKNLIEIMKWFEEAMADYEQLQNELMQVIESGIELYNGYVLYEYKIYQGYLEEQLIDFQQKLVIDVQSREQIGNDHIDEEIRFLSMHFDKIVDLFYTYLRNTIGTGDYDDDDGHVRFEEAFNALTGKTWFDILDIIMDEIDYRDDTRYRNAIEMFKTYSGVQGVAHDPYYNHKNQTHPSFQIIPFLWNFIEKTVDNTQNLFTYVKNSVFSEEFEGYYIASRINQYIGRFGEVIDKWKHVINDYTGYQTRYEKSAHICKLTNKYSEVVDYDGAFYPPALEMFLRSGPTREFMEQYCGHLNLTDETMAELSSIFNDSRLLIANKTNNYALSGVWDIFKYDLDINGNMYILYKKYDQVDPTYPTKLNTPGELWVRLADHPLAVPVTKITNTISSYNNISTYNVYDFEILGTGSKMGLAYRVKPNEKLSSDMSSSKYTQVIPLDIMFDVYDNSGTGKLVFTEGRQDHRNHTFPSSDDISNKYYVGTYHKSDTILDSVFVQGERQEDGTWSFNDNPDIYVYSINADMDNVDTATYGAPGINKIKKGTYPVAQEYGGKYLDVAFVTDKADVQYKTEFGGTRPVDVVQNSAGHRFENFTYDEMNSHDILMDDVRIVNISLSKTTGGINTNVHNTNADLGYIPQYPGVADENELDISMNLVSSYQSVELMGRSKNIDKIIDSINPDVDPYVTDETIRENGLFGRVWEDFADAPDDKSLLIIENEALFPNMGTTDEYGFTEDNDYYWKIDFGTLGYEHDQVSCLKVLIYNTTTLGRNPYFVGDLSSIVQDSTEAGVPISTNYIVDGGFQSTEIELTSGTSNIKITGTCNGVNEINGYFSNAINGIEDVRIWSEQVFNRDILKITFKRKRDQIPMDTFVDKGVVRVAIFNTRDFSRLEYYHFLDTHGFIIGRGNDAKFVYKDKDGNISNKPISEIHLSAYRNLDDIYPLATSERLQFKYSEEDVFDQNQTNYYFPCINVKFPYTVGTYYNDHFVQGFIQEDSLQWIKTFENDNVYSIRVYNDDEISDVNNVRVTHGYYETEEFRVFEDYLSTYQEDGQTHRNADRFSDYDPNFFQYVKHSEDILREIDGGEVPQEKVQDVRIDFEEGSDKFSQYTDQATLQYGGFSIGESVIDDSYQETYISLSSAFLTLTPEQKEIVKQNLKRFSRLYLAYKKEQDGLHVYVNYQNYINSPFIKMENGQVKNDIIDETYAVIPPGESRTISLVIQIRVTQNNELFGVKNITLARYNVHNLSDDKPKILIDKSGQTSWSDWDETYGLNLMSQKFDGELKIKNDGTVDRDIDYHFNVIAKTNQKITSPISCTILFNPKFVNIPDIQDSYYLQRKSAFQANVIMDNMVTRVEIPIRPTAYIGTVAGKIGSAPVLDEYCRQFGDSISVDNGYVRWNRPYYHVKLIDSYDNGITHGSGVIWDSVVQWGTNFNPIPSEKRGLEFIGWSPNLSTMHSDMTATAIYQARKYKITYNTSDGTTYPSDRPTEYTISSETIEIPQPIGRTGYTFVEQTPSVITKGSVGDVNVVAKWNRNTYTVTFKENDGSSMRLMAVKHNDTVDTYPVPSMIPSGKMFDSWKIEGTNTNIGRSHRFTENTTLVPSFKDLENVAVVVEVNDSDMGTASVQTPGEQFLAGSTVAISATPKVGYKFVNWTGTSGHIGYIQSGSSDTNNITILLPQEIPHGTIVRYTANFEVDHITLTLNANEPTS